MSISVHNGTLPNDFRVAVKCKETRKTIQQTVTVLPNTTKLATLRINDLQQNFHYRVSIKGLTDPSISHNETLQLETKRYSVFIQTDKGIYKPLEKIRFRIIVLDQNLLPAQTNGKNLNVIMSVSIDWSKINRVIIMCSICSQDADGNRIKQWKNVTATKGLFSSDLKLSKLPPLGEWRIMAEIDTVRKEKTITVKEYELPKFEVKIDAPKHFCIKNSILRIGVEAFYTFGKRITGKGLVTLSLPSRNEKSVASFALTRKSIVDFAISKSIESFFYSDEMEFSVEAIVFDELTG